MYAEDMKKNHESRLGVAKTKRTNLDFDDIMPRLFTPKNKCGWLDIKSEKQVALFSTKTLKQKNL